MANGFPFIETTLCNNHIVQQLPPSQMAHFVLLLLYPSHLQWPPHGQMTGEMAPNFLFKNCQQIVKHPWLLRKAGRVLCTRRCGRHGETYGTHIVEARWCQALPYSLWNMATTHQPNAATD